MEDPALGELRSFVTGPDGRGLLAGPAVEDLEQVTAITAYETLTCEEPDMETLEEFTWGWFESMEG
ncbi:MAG TPA: hypothetical protein VFD59_02575 [Nocardioidaceae bacterium]|nr:hypothetical protein [Nocardioidaceae bacterium]